MKKLLSILLSVLMIFSCLSVFSSALDLENLGEEAQQSFLNGLSNGLTSNLALDNGTDVEALLQSGMLDDVQMFGMSIDFLYNSNQELYWPALTISKADVALTKANINTYLATAIQDTIGDYESTKFVTAQNATKIANFIGHLLDPEFTDVNIPNLAVEDTGFYYNSFDVTNVFYTKIARYSGLIAAIQDNWIATNINFSPVLYLLGFEFDDDMMLGKSKLTNAERIGPVLVKSVIKTVCQKGPLEYILEVVARLSSTYAVCMYEPIAALFQPYLAKGIITSDELLTLKGLFNLVVNHNDKTNITKLQFISAPSYRFASCVNGTKVDTTEMFLYAMVYLTLVGKYGSNSVAVAQMKADVNANSNLSSTQKKTICSIYDGILMNDLDGLVSSMSEMFSSNVDQVGENLWQTLMNFFRNYFRSIADFFNRLFDSMANFGDF